MRCYRYFSSFVATFSKQQQQHQSACYFFVKKIPHTSPSQSLLSHFSRLLLFFCSCRRRRRRRTINRTSNAPIYCAISYLIYFLLVFCGDSVCSFNYSGSDLNFINLLLPFFKNTHTKLPKIFQARLPREQRLHTRWHFSLLATKHCTHFHREEENDPVRNTPPKTTKLKRRGDENLERSSKIKNKQLEFQRLLCLKSCCTARARNPRKTT